MAEGELTRFLDKLTKTLPSNNSILSTEQYDQLRLKTQFGLLRFFFEQARTPDENDAFETEERDLTKLVHDAEVAIDSARDLHELRYRADDLMDRMKNYIINFGDGSDEGRHGKTKKDQHFRMPDHVVGLEVDEQIIIQYLTQHVEELDVISIIGMAGLGKTTLAWRIFTNNIIDYEFKYRIWVEVSQASNIKEVLLIILKNFTSRDMCNLNDEDLARMVYMHLEESRFLVVLDDVCSVDEWNAIRAVLPKGNKHSKVLITSRFENIGRYANPNRAPHYLRFLNSLDSLELLLFEVFGNMDSAPYELRRIAYDIAQHCDGVPLAIVKIGRTLSMHLSVDYWKRVANNLSEYLKYFTRGDISTEGYNKLTPNLRDCFLYLGVFPRDYKIPVSTLIKLWIAEELIQKKPGKTLEETGEEIVKDLIGINLLMVNERNQLGQVKSCRVQDVVNEFCIQKASVEERNLFEVVKVDVGGEFSPSIPEIEHLHRLCIHSSIPEFLSKKLKSRTVRSLLCFTEEPVTLDANGVSAIFNSFHLLRVLFTNSIKLVKLPRGLTALIHLRYLTLCCDNLHSLPKAMSKLSNLQTLVVDTESDFLTMKANIWRMIELRHLTTKAAIVLVNQGGDIRTNKNLQTLSRLSPKSCTRGLVRRAPNLKKLGIRGELSTLDAQCLRKLNHLENLKLVNDLRVRESSSRTQVRLHPLPHATLTHFPVRLKTLTLSATHLDWQHVSKLATIGTLQALKLKNNAFTGSDWETSGPCFEALQFLLISDADLFLWVTSADYFPSLSCVVLNNCRELCEIPFDLPTSLKKLVLVNLTMSAVDSAREIEYYRKTVNKLKGNAFELLIHQLP